MIVKKNKRTCQFVDFAVPADHRAKLKESEKKDKYLDLAKELKKTEEHESDSDTNCNWDLTIRRQMETIQTTVLLRSARILRRVLESWCYSQTRVRNYRLTLMGKNSQKSKMKIITTGLANPGLKTRPTFY